MRDTKWPAPAKLNLFLHVIGRRNDGYHQLQTVFQIISLCDYLSFQIRDDGVVTSSNAVVGVKAEEDLTLRAANLLKEKTSTKLGVDIFLEKNIPMGAGLGGGSSDAATTLMALNDLWKLGLKVDELAEMSVTLGADVPVFVYGKSAWAEGIGDQLTAITLPKAWYAVFVPSVHVSTAEIYMSEDLTRDSIPIKISRFLEGYTVNTLEEVVFKQYPKVKAVAEWLASIGAEYRMSGSGCSVFAKFGSRKQAQAILEQSPYSGQSFLVEGYNESPLNQMIHR